MKKLIPVLILLGFISCSPQDRISNILSKMEQNLQIMEQYLITNHNIMNPPPLDKKRLDRMAKDVTNLTKQLVIPLRMLSDYEQQQFQMSFLILADKYYLADRYIAGYMIENNM